MPYTCCAIGELGLDRTCWLSLGKVGAESRGKILKVCLRRSDREVLSKEKAQRTFQHSTTFIPLLRSHLASLTPKPSGKGSGKFTVSSIIAVSASRPVAPALTMFATHRSKLRHTGIQVPWKGSQRQKQCISGEGKIIFSNISRGKACFLVP